MRLMAAGRGPAFWEPAGASVEELDPNGLAFACGVRQEDIIAEVDGKVVWPEGRPFTEALPRFRAAVDAAWNRSASVRFKVFRSVVPDGIGIAHVDEMVIVVRRHTPAEASTRVQGPR